MTGIARLTGSIKHYDWGGKHFIPALLRQENAANKPYAEYWLGVHPLADCIVETNEPISLRNLIAKEKSASLGANVSKRFGNLPYLLKTLDVKDMLSIQVHPAKSEAEEGFARENEAGIAIDSPRRNYKDPNHKPELLAALGDFWLLHGFKSTAAIKRTLADVKELNGLLKIFTDKSYAGLYRHIMTMPATEVNEMLGPLLKRIIPLYNEQKLDRSSADFWAARAATTFSANDIDPGIFSIYLFNLVYLKKGQAMYQAAGVPHAYLEGQNVEIMANSDNVLRGGLTTKHIDVDELLQHVVPRETKPSILDGDKKGAHEIVYHTAAPDFELSRFELKKGEKASFKSSTLETLLLTEGMIEVSTSNEKIELKYGSPAAIVFPAQTVNLKSLENAMLFRATVPS